MLPVNNVRWYFAAGIGAVLFVGASVGVGWASTETSAVGEPTIEPGAPMQYSSALELSASPALTTATPNEALTMVMANGVAPNVVSAAIGSQPDPKSRAGNWFYPRVKLTTTDRGGSLLPEWEAYLQQGVLADMLSTTQNNSSGVVGSDIIGILPDKTTVDLGGGAGDVRSHQLFQNSKTPIEIGKALSAATAAVESFSLKVADVRILRPQNDALYIVVRIPAGMSFTQMDQLRIKLTGTPVQYEGVYLEIQNAAGLRLAISATSYRTGVGEQWLDPSISNSIGGPPHG